MMPREHVPVVILGAGLTGLMAALELARRGIDSVILERAGRAGGHAVTESEAGYRFDRTGHLLHLRAPELRAQVSEWLGGDYAVIQRQSLVFSHGVYTRYPYQANTFGLPPRIAYECLLGFLQRPTEPPAPRNFEEFCRAHFGDGFTDHFMLPYNEKLWGVSAHEITAEWCQRFVPLPKLEDVIAGAVGLGDRRLGYNTEFWYPRLGIGQLADALAARVPRVTLNARVHGIRAASHEIAFDDRTLGYDVLINTAPLPAALRLFHELPTALELACARLRATPLYYLDIALTRPPKREFHWVYVPEPKYPFYRVGCYSSFSEAMAPPGKGSLYVELSGRTAPDADALWLDVVANLVEMNLIDGPEDVAFWRLRKLDPAYVIYDHAYRDALDTIEPFLAEHRVISTGRYGGWNYSSMEDALGFGQRAAATAAEWLRERR